MAFQGDSIFWVEVEIIVPNPFQPRREFDEDKLKELAESVRMYGILQPLTVTRNEIQNEDGSFRSEYELIAGERRLRASRIAGLSQVPVIIREGAQSEQEKLELAIIENLQREDLNAVDRAIAFRQLSDVFGLSHALVAKKMGRSREYVSNSIRLLALPDYMLTALRVGDISEGHCRALLMLNDRPEQQDTVFREILLKKLTVREVERIARHIATEKIRKKGEFDLDLIEMEKKFTESLGTRVSITKTDFGGRLSVDYFSQEELESMLEGMLNEARKSPGVSVPMVAPSVALGAVAATELGNPRADELAILTESTGLEIVEETASVLVPRVPIIPVPVMVSLPIDESVAAPIEVEPQEVISPFVVPPAETSYTQPVFEQEEVVPVQSTDSANSLRDQLASLFGSNVTPMIPVVQPIQPSPLSNVVMTEPTPHVKFEPAPVVPAAPPPPKPADESDLYSIRDFSI